MNTAFKHIVARTYKPWLIKYLSKTRPYRYKNIRMDIAPEVFHPGFFFSTQLLLQYLGKLDLKGKNILELGCGSGLISIVAAKSEATVTATDINPVAIEFLHKNCRRNKASIEIIESDLFNNIPQKKFDVIVINPPYYKKQPVTARDFAWFCGENGEYFENMFGNLEPYTQASSEVLMVLCDGCDMDMIHGFAEKNGLVLNCVYSKQNLLEKNFIFKIVRK